METGIFITSLGQALFESCGQALLIYVTLQLIMQLFPGIGSKYRYDINYLGLTIISCWFLANLVKLCLHNASAPNYNLFAYNTNMVHSPAQQLTILQQAEAYIGQYAKYITGLYITGLILHAFRLLGGFLNIHHIRKQKNLSQDSLWSAKTHELVKKLKIVTAVSLYFSEHIRVPLTIGHFKPIIIFPIALINNLDADQVEAILLHELAHVKRQDYLLNILQCIMETILCFNPFVWLISKTIREQREYCCDDMVVDEEYNNYTYAKALFIVAQQNNQSYPLAMASTGTKKYPLLNRIKRLHTMNANDSLPKFNLLVILTIAAIGALLTWGIPQYTMAKTRAKVTPKVIAYHTNKLALYTRVKYTEGVNPLPVIHTRKLTAVYMSADTASNTVVNDTAIKAISKFKIVIDDGKGDKKEYNSVDELPPADRTEFLKETGDLDNFTFKFGDSLKFAALADLKLSKKQALEIKLQAERMGRQFNSPAWKKQMRELQLNAAKMGEKFNSPEWKKQMEDMQLQMKVQFDNPEWKKQMEDMQLQMKAQFDNPEWKKQMEDVQIQAKEMSKQMNSPEWKKQMQDMKIRSKKMAKQFNSPEWKKSVKDMALQAEKMSKQVNSPEWKKQMEDMQKKVQDEVDQNMKAVQDSVVVLKYLCH